MAVLTGVFGLLGVLAGGLITLHVSQGQVHSAALQQLRTQRARTYQTAFTDLANMDSSARVRSKSAGQFRREHRAVVTVMVSLDIYSSDRVMGRFLHAEGAIDELEAAQQAGDPSTAIDTANDKADEAMGQLRTQIHAEMNKPPV
jgi:hypothetical protein